MKTTNTHIEANYSDNSSRNSDKSIKIYPIRCGQTKHPLSLFINGGIRNRKAIKNSQYRGMLPVWAFLVVHPKGKVLIDCGTSDGGIIAGLQRNGFKPEDIDWVTSTCFDEENIGGLRTLAEAGVRKLILSEEEYYWTCRTVFAMRQPKENWDGLCFGVFYHRGYAEGPFKKCFDFFGDGSLCMHLCPGHSFGSSAVVIRNNGKQLILAGPVVLDGTSFEEGYVYDKGRQKKNVEWLRKESVNSIYTLATHDLHCAEGVIEL